MKSLTQLRQALVDHFNKGELRALCSDLGVDYDGLPAFSKADKARELIAQLERHGRISALLELGRRLRPELDWSQTYLDDHTPTIAPAESSEHMLIRTLVGHQSSVKSVAITPDGRYAVSGSIDHTLRVWELASGQEVRKLKGHYDAVNAVAVTPDGRYAVSAAGKFLGDREMILETCDNTVRVWELASGREVCALEGHSDYVFGVALTPDGHSIITTSEDGTIKIWRLVRHLGQIQSARQVCTFKARTNWGANAVVVMPDGCSIIFASGQELKLWRLAPGLDGELASGGEVGALTGHTAAVMGLAVTADGRYAISASNDHALKVWDLASGRETLTLAGHTDGVLAVAVTPDGRHAVSTSKDKTLKVWQLSNGREVRTLKGHTSWVEGVAVTPDGRNIVSASNDKTLKVWRLL